MTRQWIVGRTFVIAGKLKGFTHKQAKSAITAAGGRAVGDVSRSTDVLVAGDRPGGKVAEAQSLGVEMWDEAAFARALKRSSPVLKSAPSVKDRRKAAESPSTSVELLAQLAVDADESVRWGVATNPSTPPQLLAQLTSSEDALVRWGVAANPSMPPKVLAQLAVNADANVREGVARNPSTPRKLLAQLAADGNDQVRKEVATNPSAPPQVLAQLAADEVELVRATVAGNPSTPPQVLAQLATYEDDWVKERVAGNPSTPPSVLTQLANDEDSWAREAVAGNPSTPAGALRELAQRAVDHPTRVGLGLSDGDRSEARRALDENLALIKALVANPSSPREVVALFAQHRSKVVRGLVMEHPTFAGPASPPGDLVQLWSAERRAHEAATSSDHEVLRALHPRASTRQAYNLACNLATPTDVLDLLADDTRETRGLMPARAVAANPSTSDATLRRMALGTSTSIRRLVSRNPSSSEETKAAAVLLGTKRPRRKP